MGLQALFIQALQVKPQIGFLILADLSKSNEAFLYHRVIVSVIMGVAFAIAAVLILMVFEQTR